MRSESEERNDLDTAALRLLRFGFDRVPLPRPTLGYEPRSSDQCGTCAALWVGSKSGPILRIDLRTASARAAQWFLPGNREARAIKHLHLCGALAPPDAPSSFLLIGRDDGFVEIVDDRRGFTEAEPRQHHDPARQGFHLGAVATDGPVVIDWRAPDRHAADARSRHRHGVTAIETFADPADPEARWILVATRAPALHVLRARAAELELHGTLALPGWIEWIVKPEGQRTAVLCVSRGGDIVAVELAQAPWRSPARPLHAALALHPTAVLPFGDGLLIGTKRGLAVVRRADAKAIALPITRAPVLCLDRATLPGHDQHFVTMGLEDGRLRVVHSELISNLLDHELPAAADHRRFSVEIGTAVLALETVCTARSDEAFVLAMASDHTLHLFKVQGEVAQRTAVQRAWDRRVGLESRAQHEAAEALVREPGDADVLAARQNLVVVHVLPRLLAVGDPAARERATGLAIQIAQRASDRVLRALTFALRALGGGDVTRILRLSRAVLAGIVRDRGDDPSPPRWEAAIRSHLGQLHRLAAEATGDDATRLIAWARFVRKYIVRSQTFLAKRLALGELVAANHGNAKYFDALIYHALLAKRCYDLQWERAASGEVAQLHAVSGAVVIVAADATLRFITGAGTPLAIVDGRGPDDRGASEPALLAPWTIAPFGSPARDPAAWTARRRVLASTALALPSGLRIVIAADGEALPPAGLAIVDLQWTPEGLMLTSVRHVRVVAAGERPPAVRVHALCALPATQIFVAGLESPDHPVGRLSAEVRGGWSLELADGRDAADDHRVKDSELASFAPGKLSTRALAVSALPDRRFLVVAGSDHGQVRVFACLAGDPAATWRIALWHQLTSAITSIALGRHPGGRPGAPVLSCYLATVGGETLALSIVDRPTDGASFAGFQALPLWRETHDSPVVAMQLWQTPLYDGADDTRAVLAVATRSGRLVLYNHGWFDSRRVSTAQNYWFRGKRLERLMLPSGVSTIALPAGRDVIAAAPGGAIYAARLVFLRDTDERGEPEPGEPEAGDALPATMWARFRCLIARSDVDWLLRRTAEEHEQLMIELCELVPIPALREYALRHRLEPRDGWLALDAAGVADRAYQALRGLDPDRADDAARIKIILKAVSRAFLWRKPAAIAAIIHAQHWPRPAETAATCEIVSGYLTHELARSTSATARLRVVAIKELLRVGLLHHMARGDATSQRIADAVSAAFETCLRDDDRIVRIETVRALSVMLRNARLMEREAPGVAARLFPDGLASLGWALEPVLARLARFPAHRDMRALINGAWYRISVLAHVFRLFPHHTIALCDHITRARGGDDIVRYCLELVQRPSSTPGAELGDLAQRRLVALIELYLLDGVDLQDPKAAQQLRYRATDRLHELRLESEHAGPPADGVLAAQLGGLLARLADLWSADSIPQLAKVLAREAEAAAVTGPFEGLAAALADLGGLGAELCRGAGDAMATLHALRGKLAAMPPAAAAVIHRVLDSWQRLAVDVAPASGHTILDRYTLAGPPRASPIPLREHGIAGEPDLVAVVLWPADAGSSARFKQAIELNAELARRAASRPYVVDVLAHGDRPRPAYVARRHAWLDGEAIAELSEVQRIELCERLLEDIGSALIAVHGTGRHGAVSRSTIAVEDTHRGRCYRLGRFERGECIARAEERVPSFLSRRPGLDPRSPAYPQWCDVAAFLLMLYEILTDQGVRLTDDLKPHRRRLDELAAARPHWRLLQWTVRLLRQLLDVEAAAIPATALRPPSSARGAMTTPLQLLHLSDLHFERADEVMPAYAALRRSLDALQVEQLDGLVVSGDLVARATPEEYDAAAQFLELARTGLGFGDALAIVPGNHDLCWDAAKAAYDPVFRDALPANTDPRRYFADSPTSTMVALRDEERYRQRFAAFAAFYQRVTGKAYPLAYDQQWTITELPGMCLVGLSSAWEIDHHHRDRASLHRHALASMQLAMRGRDPDELRVAIFHHPLSGDGEAHVDGRTCLEQLAAGGFKLALHGHIHRPAYEPYLLDRTPGGRRLSIVGAGTFGAVERDWAPGYPLTYHLLQITPGKVIVRTTCRHGRDGEWLPFAHNQQGPGQDPRSSYTIDLGNHAASAGI